MATMTAGSNTIVHDDLAVPPVLQELVRYLEGLRGRAELSVLDSILSRTPVTRQDVEPFCRFGTRCYLRNIIRRSEHFELLALCWRSGHCTPIHDHQGSSCAFRVVQGEGTEIRFKNTASGLIVPVETNRMSPGYICAAEDDDIHQVANMQAAGEDLVTMHIYSPPIRKMNTYAFATPGVISQPVEGFCDGGGV